MLKTFFTSSGNCTSDEARQFAKHFDPEEVISNADADIKADKNCRMLDVVSLLSTIRAEQSDELRCKKQRAKALMETHIRDNLESLLFHRKTKYFIFLFCD
jgi:hypothetical protein